MKAILIMDIIDSRFFGLPDKLHTDMEFKQWLESMELMSLRRHLKNPSMDLARHAWDFVAWRGSRKIMVRLGISPEAFQQGLEDGDEKSYMMAERIGSAMSTAEMEDFLAYLNRNNPGDVPTHSLMDLQTQRGRKGYLPPSWLIHFSDDAETVAEQGLTKGQGDIDRLALTLHQSKHEKEYGGYNFAFQAGSRYARQVARSGKYGRHAVMFQAAGIPVYHHSDEEDQVVTWGKDISPASMVLLTQDGGMWTVRSRRGNRDPFIGSFDKAVEWVMRNYGQYQRIL